MVTELAAPKLPATPIAALELEDFPTGVEPEDTESEAITEPFDPTQIHVDSKLMTLDLLLTRLREGEIDLAPDFQRNDGIWTRKAESRLIESLLIRIPLPAFFMDASDDERWLVIDGKQRLTALKRFAIDKQLPLSELEFLRDLDGKRFDDLNRSFQRRIQETEVAVFLIERGTPPNVRLNIFKRINTGGLPLSAQEIRHAMNPGAVRSMLHELASCDEFRRATSNGIRDKRMADRECVLRFLAFTVTPYEQYTRGDVGGDLDSFLNGAMAQINKMSDGDRDSLRSRFRTAMETAYAVFESEAFRKHYRGTTRRWPINKALFETWSVQLGDLNDNQRQTLVKGRSQVREASLDLLAESAFDEAISQGTGDPRKVRTRFEGVKRVIADVVG